MNHPLRPRSPYGASKCAARHLVKVYRESYNIFAIHCILFNHEGIRRGKEFVTRKITSNIARIKKEFDEGKDIVPFELGNINAKRDWSDSEDFVEAIWLMLNQDQPREYVLSSNETHTVKEFIEHLKTLPQDYIIIYDYMYGDIREHCNICDYDKEDLKVVIG